MKARVDSREFSTAIAQAMKWTRVTGVDVSGLVRLRAVDNYVLIRTTILDGDSVLAVNAFDVEHGDVITRASLLNGFAWQTDGWLDISLAKRKLILAYEDFASPGIGTVKEAQFPVLLDMKHPVTLTKDILLAASVHTQPFEKTGLPIKSSVHIVPAEGGVMVMGTDSYVGYRRTVDGVSLDAPISIEARMLAQALGGITGAIKIGVKEGRVEVASRDAPSRVQFSSMACPDPTGICAFFDTETHENVLEIPKAGIKRLGFVAGKAASLDDDNSKAEIRIQGSGMIRGEVLGQDITIPAFDIAPGDSAPITFLCSFLSRALSMLSDAEVYRVSFATRDGEPMMWFIDSNDARHFIMASAPGRFK